MDRIVLNAALSIYSGQVGLTPEQAKPRLHCLKAVKQEIDKDRKPTPYARDGVYDVTGPISFKAGEKIGYSGQIGRNGIGRDRDAEELAGMEAVERAVKEALEKERAGQQKVIDKAVAAATKQLAEQAEKTVAELTEKLTAAEGTIAGLRAELEKARPAQQ